MWTRISGMNEKTQNLIFILLKISESASLLNKLYKLITLYVNTTCTCTNLRIDDTQAMNGQQLSNLIFLILNPHMTIVFSFNVCFIFFPMQVIDRVTRAVKQVQTFLSHPMKIYVPQYVRTRRVKKTVTLRWAPPPRSTRG